VAQQEREATIGVPEVQVTLLEQEEVEGGKEIDATR